jgi:hypothetical protein
LRAAALRALVARAVVLGRAGLRRVVFFDAFVAAVRVLVVRRAATRALFFFFLTGFAGVLARRAAALAEVFRAGRPVDRLDGRAGLGRLAMKVPPGR